MGRATQILEQMKKEAAEQAASEQATTAVPPRASAEIRTDYTSLIAVGVILVLGILFTVFLTRKAKGEKQAASRQKPLPNRKETLEQEVPPKKGIFARMLDTRLGTALFFLLAGIATGVFFGFFGIFFGDFLKMAWITFWWFGASMPACSVLLVLTKIPQDEVLWLGPSLYYGTIFAQGLLENIVIAQTGRWIIGFIITALVCSVIYLKRQVNKLR